MSVAGRPPAASGAALGLVAAILLALVAGCAPTPPPQSAQRSPDRPACKAGTDARGIAAGFFAIFQDRPECF